MEKILKGIQHLATDIATINLDPKNARTHDDKNMKSIKDSLSRFGQRIPIVVQRDGMVVRAGNGRLAAARALGWTSIAAVIVDDTDEEAIAFAIADNRTGDLSAWNWENLSDALQMEDIGEVGFDDEEIQAIISNSLWDGLDNEEVPRNEDYEKFEFFNVRVPERHEAAMRKALAKLEEKFKGVEVT